VNVWFLQDRSAQAEERRKKLTEHEVALVAAPGIIICSDRSPLTFPGGDPSIDGLPWNLSVTAYFLYHQ
jgi:hypothetical protein